MSWSRFRPRQRLAKVHCGPDKPTELDLDMFETLGVWAMGYETLDLLRIVPRLFENPFDFFETLEV